jgi:amino acid adenylation domain-containing protein
MSDGQSVDFDPFAAGEIASTTPTTEPQREIWVGIELGGREASLAFNESVSVRLSGPIDRALLEASLAELVARHESLRATFTPDGATLCVTVNAPVRFTVDDLKGLPSAERDARRRAIVHEEVTTPFDLVNGPVYRARYIELAEQSGELVFTAHHIVCDGYSSGVLLVELAQGYSARAGGAAPSFGAAPTFSDYAVAHAEATQGPEAAAAERHWLTTLGTTPATLDLPTDRPRPLLRTYDATREDWLIEPALVEGLRSVGKRLGCSFVATLLATFDAFLYRLTGQTDFVIGMPAAGQADAGFDGLVGHCVNTLPLRLRFDPTAPFSEHVRSAKSVILSATEHQTLSFGGLLQKLELPRDPSRIPLIPVLFNVDPRLGKLAFGPLAAEFVTNARAYETFELFLNASETERGLVIETTFNTNLFDRSTILRWLEQWTTLMRGVVDNPELALGRLPVLSPAERERLLVTWNATERPLACTSALALFEAQVKRTPNAIAVRDLSTALTYRELDGRANALAHHLRGLGVGTEDKVGVAVDRSVRMLVALLSVWKCGAAYVPLDPDYPPARLAFIAEDAALHVLLTERSLADVLTGSSLERVFVEELTGSREDAVAREDAPDRLAYVLHTSGSTGQPKGVQIEHAALANFLSSMADEPGLTSHDVLVAVTTLSFDIAGLELFLPLTVGAQSVIASREVAMDGRRLASLIETCGATVLQATPATWRLLVEAAWAGSPRFKALCGGEALPRELAQELLPRVGSLWNVYGPTETTIWSTCARITSAAAPITIGRPIANTTVFLLDAAGEPVPTGAVGELLIGGLGVARGYLNRPELTAERFIPDPFSTRPGARLYRTGDLARFDGSGSLYFERRNDGQVKVRGFRVELGEIESALESHPRVKQAAALVLDLGAGDVRLVGYYVARAGEAVAASELKPHIADRVPPYMVPQHLLELEAMPLTPNGKVDRKALPRPESGAETEADYVAPVTAVQTELARLWAELLRLPRFGLRDSFFERGGHSMLAARMLARVRERLGVELGLRTVFQAQTLEAFSAHVEAALLQSPRASGESAADLQEIEF